MTALHYERILTSVADRALQAGRDPDQITVVVVSKMHPWQEVAPIYSAGGRHFGENRVQDALDKIAMAPDDVVWHFIGSLQTNKVRRVIENFSMIHSVDNVPLARKIAQVSLEMGVTTSIFLQVNVSGELSKRGFSQGELKRHFYGMYILPGIRIEGFMTMAPQYEREEVIRSYFSHLRMLNNEYGLKELSMGMSGDWQIAVDEGATYLRIGSAIFNP